MSDSNSGSERALYYNRFFDTRRESSGWLRHNNAAFTEDMTMPIMKPLSSRASGSRTSLVPGRSILKQTLNFDENHTVIGIMNMAQNADLAKASKKILNRRVSFAPEAFVRIFPDEEKAVEEKLYEPRRRTFSPRKPAFSMPKSPVKLQSPTKQRKSPVKLQSPIKSIPDPPLKPFDPFKISPRRSPRLNNLSVEKRALENPKPSPVSKKQPEPVELPTSQHKILADDEFLISFESPERVDSKNVFEGSQNTAGASPVQEEEQIEQEEPTMELTNIAPENHDEEISEEEEMEMELSRVMDSEDEQNDDLVDEHSMEMTRPLNTMENEVSDDEMDFTVAIGQEEVGIVEEDEQTMDMTRSIGRIAGADSEEDEEHTIDITGPVGRIEDEDYDAMDLTRPIGRIETEDDDINEELTMDITRSFGGIDASGENEEGVENGTMETTQVVNSQRYDSMHDKENLTPFGVENIPLFQLPLSNPKILMSPKRKYSGSPLQTPRKRQKSLLSTPPQKSPSRQPLTPVHVLREKINGLTPKRSPQKTPSRYELQLKQYLKPEFELVNYSPLKAAKVPSEKVMEEQTANSPTPMKRKRNYSLGPIEEQGIKDISLQQFLKMISIDFMDDLFKTSSSRSSSSFGLSNERAGDPTLADYVVAGNQLNLLDLYDFGSREMKGNIKEAKRLFDQYEEETLENNPVLLREYMEVSADAKQLMNTQFKTIKSYCRQGAKGIWYNWRTQLTTGLRDAFKKNLESLKDDLLIMNKRKDKINSAHTKISEQHQQMKARVEILRKANAELANVDREQFAELQEAYGESKGTLQSFQLLYKEKSEGAQKLIIEIEALNNQKQQVEQQITQVKVIVEANRKISTQELLMLRQSHFMVQQCIGFKGSTVKGTILNAVLYDTLQVTIDMAKQDLSVQVRSTDQCLIFFATHIRNLISTNTLSNKLQRLNMLWHAATVINRQLTMLKLRHIVTISKHDIDNLHISVLLIQRNCKTSVEVRLNYRTLVTYPSIEGEINVSSIYGKSKIKEGNELQRLLQAGLEGISQRLSALAY